MAKEPEYMDPVERVFKFAGIKPKHEGSFQPCTKHQGAKHWQAAMVAVHEILGEQHAELMAARDELAAAKDELRELRKRLQWVKTHPIETPAIFDAEAFSIH